MKTGQVKLFDKVFDVHEIEHATLGKGIEIDLTAMYEPPHEFNFGNMLYISEYFGTQEIDWNHISERGCETCDYGSRYGFEVQIYSITKNYPELMEE